MISRIAFSSLLIIFSAFLFYACERTETQVPTIRLGHAPHDHHSPLYVAALDPEYFKKNGGLYLREVERMRIYEVVRNERVVARLTIDSSTGGKELIRKLAEDQFDLAFGGFPAMLGLIDKGSPIRVVAPVMSNGSGLVVGNDLPGKDWDEFIAHVRASSNPVRIGFKIAMSVQNLAFEEALRLSDISYSTDIEDTDTQIIMVNLHGAKNLIPSLKVGLIDGFVVNQPLLAKAVVEGSGRLVALIEDFPSANEELEYPCCALGARKVFARENPAAAQALVELVLRGSRYIREHPDKAAGFIADWLGTTTEIEALSLPTISFKEEFDLQWEVGANAWIEAMIRAGLLKGEVLKAHREGRVEEVVYDRALIENVGSDL